MVTQTATSSVGAQPRWTAIEVVTVDETTTSMLPRVFISADNEADRQGGEYED